MRKCQHEKGRLVMPVQPKLIKDKEKRFDVWIVGLPGDPAEHLQLSGIFLTQESAQAEADALSTELGTAGFYKIELMPVYR